MSSSNIFRIAMIGAAVIIGVYGLGNALGQLAEVERSKFPQNPELNATPPVVPGWVWTTSSILPGLGSDRALTLAFRAMGRPPDPDADRDIDEARTQLRAALSSKPYDAELWLALAQLESRRDPSGPGAIESLKMAYFVAPSDTLLMPVRLDTATRFEALADPDLKELARGDVRLMLRNPEQKAALGSSFRRASPRGKAFLEETVRAIEPSFLASLRS